jgi:hypothetical protein
MFGSDVLDAAAIGAGAALLGGIIAGFFSYITTRANNKTELSKIAFNKRLDAFREIYAALSKSNQEIKNCNVMYNEIGLDMMYEDGDDYINGAEKWSKVYYQIGRDFLGVYYKNKIYLPPPIDKKIRIYIDQTLYIKQPLTDPTEQHIAFRLGKAVELIDKLAENIVLDMQKFIGL